MKAADVLGLVGINTPFWVATVWNSQRLFAALPAEPPHCFVVTAATRGHPAIVGPFVEIAPGRRANRQLARFWGFEAWWHGQHPASHTALRRIYDRVGPCIAARIRTRWHADAVYLALKPLELAMVSVLLASNAVAYGTRVVRRHRRLRCR